MQSGSPPRPCWAAAALDPRDPNVADPIVSSGYLWMIKGVVSGPAHGAGGSRLEQASRLRGFNGDQAVTRGEARDQLVCTRPAAPQPLRHRRPFAEILLIRAGVRARYPRISGLGRGTSADLLAKFAGLCV
jgi:hypothetical protein